LSRDVLAIDIGGTNMRGAVVDHRGCLHRLDSQPSGFAKLPVTDLITSNQIITNRICSFIDSLLGEQTVIMNVGIGFPGFIHGQTGVIIASPNIPSLLNYPLAETLSRLSGYQVTVHNDGLCAAVGEYHFGIGTRIHSNNLLHSTLGTGIGGGLVLGGKPYSGESGMALEFGHIKVEYPGRACGCGSSGCLETRASATAVVYDYKQRTGRDQTAKENFQLAAGTDRTAREVIERAGWFLGLGIAQAASLLDVGHYSIGGGLANAWSLLEPAIHTALAEKLFAAQYSQIRIHKSLCMNDAGILGAALLTKARSSTDVTPSICIQESP